MLHSDMGEGVTLFRLARLPQIRDTSTEEVDTVLRS